mgnify:CR=1 FL=1
MYGDKMKRIMMNIVMVILMIILMLSLLVQTIHASDSSDILESAKQEGTVEKILNDYIEREHNQIMSVYEYVDMMGQDDIEVLRDFSFTKYWEDWFGAKFGTNKYGMSIDSDGYVVLATATYECLRDTTVGCDIYNTVPDGYSVWSYGDIIEFTIDIYPEELFIGKVYDSCGACFWKENTQRIDIHMKNKDFGKPLGKAIFNEYEGH